MSHKTRRSSHASLFVLTANRLALRKIDLACAAGLLALAPSIAGALELGSATIRSRLGDPLIVEIPYRLAAGEVLTPACVSLEPGVRSAGSLPRYAGAGRVAITPTHIEIFGQNRVLEPLIGVSVGVQCASVPRFVRSYELFVDPPSFAPAPQRSASAVANAEALPRAIPASESSVAAAPSVEAPRAQTSPQARGVVGSTLTQGQTYVVVAGDTLSAIAARVGDRPGTIRATADAIFAANPTAFARGNPDLLQAGRSITIPVLGAPSALPPVASEPVAERIAPAVPPGAAPVPQVEAELPSEPVAVVPSAQPSAVPALAEAAAAFAESAPATAEASASPPSAGPSLWLTVLLSLGVAIVLSIPLSFLRRRRREAPEPEVAKPRPVRRRQLVDPTAGIDVVEGELPRAFAKPSVAPAARSAEVAAAAAATLDFDPGAVSAADSVDLDVGVPTPADEHVAAADDPTATLQQKLEEAPTAVVEAPTSVVEAPTEIIDANVDEQHTLTVAEIDLLRADYEAEFTLTQESSKTLRDALADLKATEAAHAANADTGMLEMESDAIETQPTRKLRAAR